MKESKCVAGCILKLAPCSALLWSWSYAWAASLGSWSALIYVDLPMYTAKTLMRTSATSLFMSFPTWCQENCHLLSFPLKSCSSVHAQVVLMLPQEPEKLYTLHSGRSTTILVSLTVLPGDVWNKVTVHQYMSPVHLSQSVPNDCWEVQPGS